MKTALTDQTFKGEKCEKYWRYRVGNYRVLTEIDDLKIIIFIVKIDHRKCMYG